MNPYLYFDGRCEEAFKFYEKCTGGKIDALLTHEGAPGCQVPEDWKKKIMHARLVLDGQALMGTDLPPDHYQEPQGFSVNLDISDPGRAERIFESLAEKGQVTMPIQKTFWAERFGTLVDRFGIPWMINCAPAAQDAVAELAKSAAA